MASPPLAAHDAGADFPAPRLAWYAVAVLTVANASAFVDRQILALLVGPIQRDLGIGDAQMGVLYGLAFAVFYTVMGLPVARVADRGPRRTIIATGIAVWSVMTVLSGLAESYGALLVARFGVGIGEAALAAPAVSLIADYFPAERRATAMSVWGLGIYLGAGLANLVGGALLAGIANGASVAWPLIGQLEAWQQALVVVGAPGVLIGLAMVLVHEPPRHETGQANDGGLSLRVVAAYLRDNRAAFVSHNLGYGLFALVNNGTAAWLPTMLIRAHGWTAARAGITLGSLTATVGVIGIVVGGRTADVLLARGLADAKLRVGIVAAIANIVCGVAYTLAPTAALAVAALVPYNFFASFAFGAALAAVQEMTPNRMRAQAAALFVAVTTLVGLGFGPVVIGLLNDRVFGVGAGVRYSLLIVTVTGLGAAAVLLAAGLGAYRRTVSYRTTWREPVTATGTR